MNPYEVLGVDPAATDAQIKKAYRKKASGSHSDRNGGSDEIMSTVNVAYKALRDPASRKRYDETGKLDGNEPSITDIAYQVLNEIATIIIDKAPEQVPLINEMRSQIKQSMGNIKTELKKADVAIKKLIARQKMYKAKTDTFIAHIFEQKLLNERNRIVALNKTMDASTMALKILEDDGYEDVLEVGSVEDIYKHLTTRYAR